MKQLVHLKSEKIYSDLWRLAWPVMTFMVFQTTLELVDLFWVGKLGTSAVAALSLANSLFWLLFTFSDMITVATLSLVARYRGAGDFAGVRTVTRHSFWLALFLSAVVMIIVFAFGDRLISLYRVEADVHAMALLYLKVIAVSLCFAYSGMVLSAALQGVGDTRTPMIILVITNIINMVLDPLLIFGLAGFPALGVFGAALATLAARALGFLAMFYIVLSGKVSPSRLRIEGLFSLKIQRAYLKRIIQIGLPACMQTMTRPLTGLVMMWIVAIFGTEAVASFGIGMRLLGFSFILISGLTMATSTMVGQSLGAELKQLTAEITRKAMHLSLAIQISAAALCFFGAPMIIKIFTDSPGVVQMGTSYLRIISPALLVMGPFHVFIAVFKGSGHTVPPMASALVANWLIKIPCAFVLSASLQMGTAGVWWSISISVFAEFALLFYWYRKGDWMDRDIRVEPRLTSEPAVAPATRLKE